MTPEQQRICIAEFCGWRSINKKHYPHAPACMDTWMHQPKWDGKRGTAYSSPLQCPDYLNDLNAMHEAELKLTDKQYGEFLVILPRVCKSSIHSNPLYHWRPVISATASQRAEALLRTIGNWTE